MGAAYYEITKTMHNLPLSIYLHKKSPFQKVEAHWHRALEISIVFDYEDLIYDRPLKK